MISLYLQTNYTSFLLLCNKLRDLTHTNLESHHKLRDLKKKKKNNLDFSHTSMGQEHGDGLTGLCSRPHRAAIKISACFIAPKVWGPLPSSHRSLQLLVVGMRARFSHGLSAGATLRSKVSFHYSTLRPLLGPSYNMAACFFKASKTPSLPRSPQGSPECLLKVSPG